MIDNYDSFTYIIVDYLKVLGADVEVIKNDELDVDDLRIENYSAIVISPGPKSPVDAGISVPAIKKYAARVPILGVCLGAQAIAFAFGGKIVHAPEVVHGKTSKIVHNSEGLFRGIESPFAATRYHSLVIEQLSIPGAIKVIAKSEEGIVMAICHKKLPMYGVQFHPESILTSGGIRILANFLEISYNWNIENNP